MGFGWAILHEGDEVMVNMLEHHSNIVPWQMACARNKAKLVVCPILPDGSLDIEQFENLLSDKTMVVSFAHSSNVLGSMLPVRKICDLAHARGIPVMIDGAQAAPHMPVDMQALDCDFYVFSAHKMGVRRALKHLGVSGLIRLSFCYFNTRAEIDLFMNALQQFLADPNG